MVPTLAAWTESGCMYVLHNLCRSSARGISVKMEKKTILHVACTDNARTRQTVHLYPYTHAHTTTIRQKRQTDLTVAVNLYGLLRDHIRIMYCNDISIISYSSFRGGKEVHECREE